MIDDEKSASAFQGEARRGPNAIALVLARVLTWTDLHPLRALALILILAATLNAAKLQINPPNLDMGDAAQWWQLALSVAHGDGYVMCYPTYFPFCGPANQNTSARDPAPVLLYAWLSRLTNESLMAIGVVQLTFNLVILSGIFCLTRELTTGRAALLAALLWSLYLPAIRAVPEISGDLLATMCVTWGVFFFVRARRTLKMRHWLAAGVCVALGALSRSALLIVAPVLVADLIFWPPQSAREERRLTIRNLRAPGLFTLVVCLVLLPWLARNYVVFGRLVLTSTLADYDLYRQNFMLSTDDYFHFASAAEAEQAIHVLILSRPDLHGTENEAQMDDLYRYEALRIILANPLRYALLSGARFFMLWFDWTVNAAYGLRETGSDYVMIVQQALLLVAAAFGLRGRWPRARPLAMIVVAITLIHMAVISRMRYIIPVMPFTVTLGAIGCERVWLNLRMIFNRSLTT